MSKADKPNRSKGSSAPARKAAAPGTDLERDTRKGVQSVELAFSILRVMEAAERALAVKEIAGRLEMPPSKVHHYLVSLVRSGVLQQNSAGAYDLGPFALHLGLSALRRLDPIARSNAAAEALRDKTGEAVFVAVWGSHGPTIVRYFEGFQPVTVEVRAGLVLPVVSSATGRVFLAWGHESQLAPILGREQGVSKSEIKKIRAATRADGLGRVEGNLLPRIAALSVPVFDRDKRLALTVTALGWIGEFNVDLDGPVALALQKTARRLSSELGYVAR
ncbi:IclR family transcriptional regulator [Pelagibius sp. Alg239-R121]|uniref:IclR family transcriptional regulator n=1 Tax=Pelagibius sp. Alg239-R121 TaxID=2993448 RepID=UPI0024A67816|nr:IclR family transcriptional regulator [Pelagibius sp. Alg239-R121]